MSNAVVESKVGVPSKYATDDTFNDFVKSPFLGRLSLATSFTTLGKSGRFPMNHWAHVQGSNPPEDLTTEVEIFPLAWRPRAMNMKLNPPVSKFNPADPEFQKIQAKSDVANSGCAYGPEFLVWIPSARSFASFFLTSQGLKAIAKFLLEKMGKGEAVRLGSRFHEKGNNPRQVPTASAVSVVDPSDLPPKTQTEAEIAKFNNPPESQIETVEDAGPQRDR